MQSLKYQSNFCVFEVIWLWWPSWIRMVLNVKAPFNAAKSPPIVEIMWQKLYFVCRAASPALSQHTVHVEFFLTGECAEYCVIGQKSVGMFLNTEKCSDNNGCILLQPFYFQMLAVVRLNNTALRSSCLMQSENISIYMALLNTKNG